MIAVPSYILGLTFPIIGGPMIAIVAGMIIAIFFKEKGEFSEGIKFTSKKVLQWAVVLLGFGMNLSVVAETGVGEPSVGIGVGLDTSLSYFIGESKAIGFTVGATVYPQFFVFDDIRDTHFSIMANGYIGMALRFPASLIVIPVLDYILD